MTETPETPEAIPFADNLTIPWPSLRPFDVPVSADGVRDMWETLVAPMVADHPQSIEERILMAVVRAVYAGMYGTLHEPQPGIRAQSDG